MATTITPYEALQYAERVIKRMPLEEVYVDIANDVHQRIWQAANWSWTVAATTGVTIPLSTTGGSQLVEFTSLSVPAARFIEGVLVLPMATGGGRTDQITHLKPVSLNVLSAIVGPPTTFQYIPVSSLGNDGFRFNTKPAYPVNGSFYALYKTIQPILTASTLHSVASGSVPQLPDDYYNVYRDGVLWLAMQYAGDQRQGSIQVVEGKVQYTGQLGVFMRSLEAMKAVEPVAMLDYRTAQDSKE